MQFHAWWQNGNLFLLQIEEVIWICSDWRYAMHFKTSIGFGNALLGLRMSPFDCLLAPLQQ